jgi:hypothetical protein
MITVATAFSKEVNAEKTYPGKEGNMGIEKKEVKDIMQPGYDVIDLVPETFA